MNVPFVQRKKNAPASSPGQGERSGQGPATERGMRARDQGIVIAAPLLS
jgi:hypothetical protein